MDREKINEILKELDELFGDRGISNKKDEKKYEKVKNEIMDELNGSHGELDELIFMDRYHTIVYGRMDSVLALISCAIDSMQKDISLDLLVRACIYGLASKQDGLVLDKGKVLKVIKEIEKMI